MTTLLEKGQFVTIEFFTDEDQEERLQDGDRDFYFIHDLNDETLQEAIYETISNTTVEQVYISVSPRRYAEVVIEDNEIEEVVDYGDSTLGTEVYVYNSVIDTLLEESDHKMIYG
tara:strand:- start:143 stop:487 length:345 start_codon:yes stop_codon:yes gene_type:complete